MGMCSVKDTKSMNYCLNKTILENKMALFQLSGKKIGQITHSSICDGINNTQMYT